MLKDDENLEIWAKEPDEIIEYYKNKININPKSELYLNNRGVGYARKKQFDEAIADFEESIKNYDLEGNASHTYFNLATVYLFMGHHLKAIEKYTKSLNCFPSDTAFYNRGCVYLMSGNRELAIKDLTEAAEWKVLEAIEILDNLGIKYFRSETALLLDRMFRKTQNIEK